MNIENEQFLDNFLSRCEDNKFTMNSGYYLSILLEAVYTIRRDLSDTHATMMVETIKYQEGG